MKRILTTMCALALFMAASIPALAAEPEQSTSYRRSAWSVGHHGHCPAYRLDL